MNGFGVVGVGRTSDTTGVWGSELSVYSLYMDLRPEFNQANEEEKKLESVQRGRQHMPGVEGFGFRVRVQGLGFRLQGLGFMV